MIILEKSLLNKILIGVGLLFICAFIAVNLRYILNIVLYSHPEDHRTL